MIACTQHSQEKKLNSQMEQGAKCVKQEHKIRKKIAVFVWSDTIDWLSKYKSNIENFMEKIIWFSIVKI